MRSMRLKLLLVWVVVLSLSAAPAALGDWNPGDPHKMHFPQLPDPQGWDVQLNNPHPYAINFLADDWRCTESGWIDDIHFWVSWRLDLNQGIDQVRITIYDNIPVGPQGHSTPGNNELSGPGEWSFEAEDGDFTVREYQTGRQGWYDPRTGEFVPNDHTKCYQVNIDNITTKLDRSVCQPVWQEQGKIYWLAIRIIQKGSDPGHPIGWKTSQDHFMDDAVVMRHEGPNRWWEELHDPITGESLDLAFVITGDAELDFGDAPDPAYPTKMMSSGAHHVIGGPWLGGRSDAPDPEPDGQPNADATGDDNDGNDDENGVNISTLYQGETNNLVTVTVSGGGGYLHGWIDLNGDGIWKSMSEKVYGPNWLNNGNHTITISIDKSATLGPTFARFRISTQQSLGPKGGAPDGEVEDYKVVIKQQDLGDCPSPYPTKYSSNGARHIIDPDVHLGKLIDGEPDGQPSAAADGDDTNKLDDEDGVTFTSPILPGSKADVRIEASVDGSLSAWLDFNADGDWGDSGEAIFSGQPLTAGTNNLQFNVPAGISWGSTYARFRFISASVTLLYPTGQGGVGEVEDYLVYIGPLKVDNLKWSQPPIELNPTARTPVYCGWDELSRVKLGMPFEFCPPLAADDYRCLGEMPVTSVHWWGSYEGWDGPEPPQVTPISWNISFLNNIPAGGTANFSQPERVLRYIQVPADRVHIGKIGQDQFPQKPSDTCFQYTLSLEPDEYFWQGDYLDQTQDDVFWLSIQAVYPQGADLSNSWGWKTRPMPWMDDAVRHKTVWGDPFPQCVWDPIKDPQWARGVDMAFELDTEPAWVKWQQPFTSLRHWPHYEDEQSIGTIPFGIGDPTITRLVADDWRCDTNTPVTAAVWWGSYIGYPYKPCESSLMLPMKPPGPAYFLLTIWSDVPANPGVPDSFSHPGQGLWQYKAYDYDEVLVGFDKHYRYTQPPFQAQGYEPVFRYSVRLPKDDWFHQEDVNDIYWFSVVAVHSGITPPQYRWGWTNHKHVFNDNAVAGVPATPGPPPYPFWTWEELYDQAGASCDMSFMLLTRPWPPCWGYATQCHGDTDNDGWVKASDFLALKNSWYKCYPDPAYDPCADFDRDGCVKASDFLILKSYWYLSPPADCPAGGTWPP